MNIAPSVSSDSSVFREWWSFDEVRSLAGWSHRTARRRLASLSADLIRVAPREASGRPKLLYHFSAHPELFAAAERLRRSSSSLPSRASVQTPVLHPDDLAVARLRAQAVEEYRARKHLMSEERAAVLTCAEWVRARTVTVDIDERIGRHKRSRSCTVSVGGFSVRTLRAWNKEYKPHDPTPLAPERKARVGRTAKPVPQDLLNLIYGLAVQSPRGNIAEAVRRAEQVWPSEWPQVSTATLIRRIRAMDPERFCESIGKRGIADLTREHTPDVDTDYSNLRYNQLWQLDDITEDFYGHGTDPLRIIRPYVYAVIRVCTRQWICAVASETPIVQDQVRSLLGIAMSAKAGGIPEEITFERGTIACDDYLAEQLEALGVKVHRTSMDSGTVAEGAFPDRATGHFQGKGVVESNARKHHQANWDQPSQTGPDERRTAQARQQTLLAEAKRRAKSGEFLILPTPGQWQLLIVQALEKHNASPHGSLPEIVDPSTGARRYMTPNEKAAQLAAESIRVMDERLLPLFYQRGLLVPVTSNGFKLNDHWYGRWDEDIQSLAGTKILAYAVPELPDVAYVVQLSRCVERAEPRRYGSAASEMLEAKHRVRKAKLSQYQAMLRSAVESVSSVSLDSVRFTDNPTLNRTLTILAPEAMLTRAAGMRQATEAAATRQSASDARFTVSESSRPPASERESRPSPRGGLLSRAPELAAQARFLSDLSDRPDTSDPSEAVLQPQGAPHARTPAEPVR